MLLEKVFVGIDHAPHNFDVCSRVLGQGGANLDFIRSETGAMVILKGGSGDKINPLHIALNHSRSDRLATARTLAVNLVESVRQEFLQWSAQNPPTPAPAPVIPSLNVPPPSLNVAPNTLTAMPPPSLQVPQQALNVVPMPQVLQLVPQQQIFVGPDGTHYVKVTFAQTPTGNTIPATAMSMGQVGVAMQPPPQIQAYAPPPIQTYAAPHVQQQPQVEVLNGMVASPSVCAAPTLSTHSTTQREPQWDRGPANALQHQLAMHANNVPVVQPWATAPPQVAPVPAPVQVNTAAPPPVNPAPNLWAPPASVQQQTSNRPWGEPMNQPAQQQQQHHQQQQQPQQQQQQQQHQQQQQQQQQQPQPQPQQQTTPQNPLQESSLGGNIPWYKNSQNTASAAPNQISDLKPPRRFDAMWAEGEDQNNSGTSVPVWAVGSVTPKNALPDLREEIMKEKEEMGEVVNERRSPRRNRDRRMDNRGPRRDNRRDRRREHRRPYTDAEVYRRQFRSAGVLGEERNAGDENNAMLMNEDDGGEASPPEQSSNDNGGAGPSPDGNRGADEYPERPADRQPPRGGNVGASPDQGQASKWDRQERSVGTGQYNTPTTHYNINNHYTQSAPPQYNTAGSYNQPQNPTQQQQQQSGQYGQTPYKQGSGGSQQTSQQPSGTDNQPTSYDKHSQSVGSNSQSPSSYNWANAQQSQQYQAERGQWGPTQHPWNQRGGESGGNAQVGGQYGERPWGNRASMMPPPPPPPPATETQHQPAASNYWSGAY